MSNKEQNSHISLITISWLFYACCACCLFFVFLWSGESDFESNTASSMAQLKSYEEIKSQEGNFQCPAHFLFLFSETDSHQLHHQRKRIHLPEVEAQIVESRKQVAEGVSRLAENLRFQSEVLNQKTMAPLLRIQAMRRHPNQTFELKELEEIEKLDSDDGMHSILEVNHELGKPISVGEDDSFLEPALNATLNEEIEQSLSAKKQQEESPSVPQIESGMAGKPLEAPSLSDSSSESTTEKEGETNTTGNFLPLSTSKGENTSYNHKKGLEILRKFNQLARNRLESYQREIHDYSCILYKWDQTNIKIDGMDVLQMKMREKPYSMYAKSLLPERTAGRELLYWEGHYNNQLVVFSGPKWNMTLLMDADSAAIKNNASRSLLQLGFQKLLEELISISSNEEDFLDSEIRYYEQAKVGDRSCYVLEVTFPQETKGKKFYKIQVFVDEELTLPIQVIIYDWPRNGKPAKIRESYTYVIQKLNPGFKDQDFCHLFHEYRFKKYIPNLSTEEDAFMKNLVPSTSPELHK